MQRMLIGAVLAALTLAVAVPAQAGAAKPRVILTADPEKDDTVYGADLTGTFLSIFPVTDCCVLQTQLTMKDEPNYKLETDPKVLPKEGTPVRLVIVAK